MRRRSASLLLLALALSPATSLAVGLKDFCARLWGQKHAAPQSVAASAARELGRGLAFAPPPGGTLKLGAEGPSGYAVALGEALGKGLPDAERGALAERLRGHGTQLGDQGDAAGDWALMTEGQVYLEAADYLDGSLKLPASYIEKWRHNEEALRRIGFRLASPSDAGPAVLAEP